jgi:hypothetical protein
MKLDWMMLANHAEVAPNSLLYISGGGWDTIQVRGRAEGLPDEVFAVMAGHLVARLLFHVTETEREHEMMVNIMGADGEEIASSTAPLDVPRNRDLPAGWLQNVDMVLPVSGIALPREGHYVINLTVNGQWLGDRQFLAVKNY